MRAARAAGYTPGTTPCTRARVRAVRARIVSMLEATWDGFALEWAEGGRDGWICPVRRSTSAVDVRAGGQPLLAAPNGLVPT